jgi:hypothetical protein
MWGRHPLPPPPLADMYILYTYQDASFAPLHKGKPLPASLSTLLAGREREGGGGGGQDTSDKALGGVGGGYEGDLSDMTVQLENQWPEMARIW